MRRHLIKIARENRGMAAIELADLLGVSEDRIYSIERGRYRPRREEAEQWAGALNLPPDEAFPEMFANLEGQL